VFDNSVIKKTGQWWKLVLGFVGILLGGGLNFYSYYLMGASTSTRDDWVIFAIGGIFLGLGSFAFLCIFIKFPDCCSRWFWKSVSTKDHRHYLMHALGHSVCPDCIDKGHNGSVIQ
jgi:hypothetical protein